MQKRRLAKSAHARLSSKRFITVRILETELIAKMTRKFPISPAAVKMENVVPKITAFSRDRDAVSGQDTDRLGVSMMGI